MTDDTYADRDIGRIYAGSTLGASDYQTGSGVIATGETVKPGYGIYVSSTKRIYPTKSTDGKLSGVADLRDGHDIDTAYDSDATEEEIIDYIKKGFNYLVNIMSEATSPAVNIEEGDPMIIGTEDGKFRRFAYAGDAGDTEDFAGYADEYLAVSLTNDQILRMRLA